MSSSEDSGESKYPISTSQLVGITLKEIAKSIPIAGAIVSSYESVFAVVEANRIDQVLREVMKRLENLENKPLSTGAYETLVYGCDQARSDILIENKTKEYGGVIGYMMHADVDKNDVAEVLDSLRKLSVHDLKVLYKFKIIGKVFEARPVSELADFQPGIRPVLEPGEMTKLTQRMRNLFPALMRMQGLGVLYLERDLGHSAMVPDIGGLRDHLNEFAKLTPVGRKLVQALP